MDYFNCLITQLDSYDISFLNTLFANESTSKYQGITKSQILAESNLTDFTFRRTIERLEAILFVEIVKSSRKYRYFLTKFGLEAIYKIAERDEVECVTE